MLLKMEAGFQTARRKYTSALQDCGLEKRWGWVEDYKEGDHTPPPEILRDTGLMPTHSQKTITV